MSILLENISKSYNNKKVLENLNLHINKGDCVALIGNNGCGKTTTIKILCNLIDANKGKYFYNDTLITANSVKFRNQLGIVMSEPYYIESFNLEQYWQFVAKFQNVAHQDIKPRIENLIELLQLGNERKKIISTLSSGNQMKVSVGGALIHNPDTLILDEPFVNLDISSTEVFVNLLKDLKGQKTILITSHQLDLVTEICDEFLILESGRIVLEMDKTENPNEDIKNIIKNQLTKDTNNIKLDWLK